MEISYYDTDYLRQVIKTLEIYSVNLIKINVIMMQRCII